MENVSLHEITLQIILWLVRKCVLLSFVYPERGGFGEMFPEVMIFSEGFSPREISSLKEIFRRIPRAEGL